MFTYHSLIAAYICTLLCLCISAQQQVQIQIDPTLRRPLLRVVKAGDLEALEKLFVGPKIPDVNVTDRYGNTPLILAAWKGDAFALIKLMAVGAQLDACNNLGETALIKAAQLGYRVITNYLIKAGANIEIQDKEIGSALMHAVWYGHNKIFEDLIDAGSNINVYNKEFGNTPLILACMTGRKKIAHRLLTAGAQINYKNKCNHLALMYAVHKGCTDIAAELIEHPDCDPNQKVGGYPLLNWIHNKNAYDLIPLLVYRGAAINVSNNNLLFQALDKYAWAYADGRRREAIKIEKNIHFLVECGAELPLYGWWILRVTHKLINTHLLDGVNARSYTLYSQRRNKAKHIMRSIQHPIFLDALAGISILSLIDSYAYGPYMADLPPSKPEEAEKSPCTIQ